MKFVFPFVLSRLVFALKNGISILQNKAFRRWGFFIFSYPQFFFSIEGFAVGFRDGNSSSSSIANICVGKVKVHCKVHCVLNLHYPTSFCNHHSQICCFYCSLLRCKSNLAGMVELVSSSRTARMRHQ